MTSQPRTPCSPRKALRGLVAAVVATISVAACSPAAADRPTAVDSSSPAGAAVPSPATSAASPGPGAGSGFFAGSANVPVGYAVPPGWEPLETFAVVRSGADPVFGVAFFDVANIYRDGCRWALVDPPVGPTVDDLVEAYGDVPALEATAARDITVDGFDGKRLQFTVPRYQSADCRDGTFGLVQADNAGTNAGQQGPPNLWAQTPGQRNDVLIVDVDGTRLVVYALYPPNVSAQDRTDLDTILSSLEIG